MSVTVALAGASGYAGGEVARLLAGHPELDLVTVTAHSQAGARLGDVHPHLRRHKDLVLRETTVEVLAGHDVIILALPHGTSGELGAALEEASPQSVLLDLGADRRLRDETEWAAFYGGAFHLPWVYGLPELIHSSGDKQRALLVGQKRLVAPGCNAQAVTLAVAPLLQQGVALPDDLVTTLAVGPSGAGKTLRTDLLASELLGSARPYSIGGVHRHIPEIRQNLVLSGGAAVAALAITMTPILVPMSRGILAVTSLPIEPGMTVADVDRAFHEVYGDEAFIDLRSSSAPPASGDVLGSNTVALSWTLDETAGRVTVVSAIDNLVKGTAGAAIQSLNIALGLPEDAGLQREGLAP